MNTEMKIEIEKCVQVLRSGGIILYPTDTIWGIGCDATNESAVSKIYALKQRPDSKTMIILLDSVNRLAAYVREVPEQAYELMELSEQPLTVVLDGARNIAGNLIAGDGSIAIRVVKDEFCRKLVERLRKPVVSTSANRTGTDAPSSFSEISREIRQGVDYIAGYRRNEAMQGKPSTILKVGLRGEIKFIRK
jgi:L-threonylcarbamoyladenylate synthase